MTRTLVAWIADELATPVDPQVAAAARAIAGRLGAVAMLFYGSVLRTGDLDAVLDFYALTPGAGPLGIRGVATRLLWPDVSFHEVTVGGRTIRAKVAAMPLGTFDRAASGRTIDTTIWTRFAQPSALVWTADARVGTAVVQAVARAAATAARFAAVLGPAQGTARDYWLALFRQTYAAELRVEAPGREAEILRYAPERFDRLLPLAWAGAGIAVESSGASYRPRVADAAARATLSAWWVRQRLGKWLNLARLIKATFTFEGAARYGLYKVERHTGVALPLTPWRERHPILAAPGVIWHVWHRRAT